MLFCSILFYSVLFSSIVFYFLNFTPQAKINFSASFFLLLSPLLEPSHSYTRKHTEFTRRHITQITIFPSSEAVHTVLLYSLYTCSVVKQPAGFLFSQQPSGQDESSENQKNSPNQPLLPKHPTRCVGRKLGIVRVICSKSFAQRLGKDL